MATNSDRLTLTDNYGWDELTSAFVPTRVDSDYLGWKGRYDRRVNNDPSPTHYETIMHHYLVGRDPEYDGGYTVPVGDDAVFPGAFATAYVSNPSAGFSPDLISGPVPLSVNFTDQSIGAIESWEWDFGDNSPVSYEQNPTHTYENLGLYTVSLTDTGAEWSNTETKIDYISVTTDPCEGNFDGDFDVAGSDLAVFAADFGRTNCP